VDAPSVDTADVGMLPEDTPGAFEEILYAVDIACC
jgi:hypothetical protein